MRKITISCMVAGSLLFAAGCAEERIPADEKDAWEVAEPAGSSGTNVPPSATQAEAKADPTPAAALAEGVVAELKGSALRIDGDTTPQKEGDTFSRPHYFEASAPVEFTSAITMMETVLEGQNANGAVPVIGIYATQADGDKKRFELPARPIDGKQTLKDKVSFAPGKYIVSITYFKDTVGEVRPSITLEKITFKK